MIAKYLKSLTISDLLLIMACLVVAYLLYASGNSDSGELHIYKDNQLYGVYDLSKAQSIVIDEHNTVEISEGKARIAYSDCPDNRCVKQGFNRNMPIICLPNKLVLEFRDSKAEHKLILQ